MKGINANGLGISSGMRSIPKRRLAAHHGRYTLLAFSVLKLRTYETKKG